MYASDREATPSPPSATTKTNGDVCLHDAPPPTDVRRAHATALQSLADVPSTRPDACLSTPTPASPTLWRVVVPRGVPVPPVDQPADSLHWGYAPWPAPPPPQASLPPSRQLPTTGVKRAVSESDDCDDAFSEESSKDRCSSPGDADSCQMLSRKKRRGIIEKRRRDRINTSLSELRRLVPTAFEKQGSAKLEKAEILQMTVDHLKTLHAKGLDALAYDPSKLAMDYHQIGFRECAAEAARYLVTVEGLDIQDPLRMRLMSHLQCFAAQRELASKQPWYPPPTSGSTPSTLQSPPNSSFEAQRELASKQPWYPPPSSGSSPPSATHQETPNSSFEAQCEPASSTPQSPALTPLTTISSSNYQGYHHHHHHPQQHHHPHQQQHQQEGYQQYTHTQQGSAPVKPYRPWGAELPAY